MQANTHGALPVSGLHEEQVYLMFLRCCSVTATTVLSSKSIIMVTSSSADWGQAFTHLPQPVHLSVSMTM
jgi:Mrp family chromosome partitioning ATPase